MKRIIGALVLVALASGAVLSAYAGSSPRVSSGTAAQTGLRLHRLWVRTLQPNADSAPAYLSRVATADGRRHGVVYVLAGNNTDNCDPGSPVRRATLYALDAASGASLWTRSTSGPSRCTTAGPVVDRSGAYVYAPGLDGKVHRYSAGSGKETRGHGWPKAVTLMPDVEKVSATPTIANRHLYVTTSGFIGDQGHYQGHLVSIDLRTGRSNVFNTLCSNVRRLLAGSSRASNYCPSVMSGLFGRGQGTVDPVTHAVYIVSGNGPWNGRTNWGDSILKLDPTGSRLLDSFTPTNQQALANADADLGSSGPAILPTIKRGGRQYHLLVQAGKGPACDSCSGAALRLLDRDNLSGRRGPGHLGGDLFDTQAPGGDAVLTAPAVWKSPSGQAWDFVANGAGVAGYRVVGPSAGKFRLDRVWLDRSGGTTPVLSGGVLYVASSGTIRAFNPATGKVLWRGSDISDVHWQYPLVAGHRLVITDQSGHVVTYSIAR